MAQSRIAYPIVFLLAVAQTASIAQATVIDQQGLPVAVSRTRRANGDPDRILGY
jgi:hypothetical protein